MAQGYRNLLDALGLTSPGIGAAARNKLAEQYFKATTPAQQKRLKTILGVMAEPEQGGSQIRKLGQAEAFQNYLKTWSPELQFLQQAGFAQKEAGGGDEGRLAAEMNQLAAQGLQLENEAGSTQEQIARLVPDLARYGVQSLTELRSVRVPSPTGKGSETLFYNTRTNQILPKAFGSSMKGKGGSYYALQDVGDMVLPSARWKSSSSIGMDTLIKGLGLIGAGLGGISALSGAIGAAPAAAGASAAAPSLGGGLVAPAGALTPNLAFAPMAAPATTIGGGAAGSGILPGAAGITGITAGAGALMPQFAGLAAAAPTLIGTPQSQQLGLGQGIQAPEGALTPAGLANAPAVPAQPTIGGGGLGQGILPNAGGITGITPSAGALLPPSFAGAAPTPAGVGEVAKEALGGAVETATGGKGLMDTLSSIGSPLASVAKLAATLLGAGAGIGAGLSLAQGGGAQTGGPPTQTPPTLPPMPDLPQPATLLDVAKTATTRSVKRRRGRSATILTDAEGGYEAFKNP